MAWPYNTNHYGWPVLAEGFSGTTTALSSAYTYASAGAASVYFFQAPTSGNLTDVWVHVSSYTGTWGNTDGVINVEIREGLNGTHIPGTTLTGSFTITLNGSTTGWIKKSSLSIALAAGKSYAIVVADADGGTGSASVTLVGRRGSFLAAPRPSNPATYHGVTANGFATAATNNNGYPAIFLKYDGVMWGGSPFDSLSSATGTNEWGCRFRPPENCLFVGVACPTSHATYLNSNYTFKLYADATNPAGTTLASASPGIAYGSATAPVMPVFLFPPSSHVALTGGTWYRLAADPGGTYSYGYYTTAGSPDTDILGCAKPFNGDCNWMVETTGPTWDDSNAAYLPQIFPILYPNTDSAAGGGVLTHPGMAGGMRG